MKLMLPESKLAIGNETIQADFAIGDVRVIMEILRSKMYSNPIRTVCQEIMSNARDAHREVGKGDVPIEVKLPTTFDKTFHIRDFGPGITPERMGNVFIRYGNSTKRSDNEQTGGFGLGAKSPFAYSDTFGIISITPEESVIDGNGVEHKNVMVKRQYVALIDPSRVGKMSLISSEITTEEQGTTIVITCKPTDLSTFSRHVLEVAQYWEVKPTIKGDSNWKWPTHSFDFQGADNAWAIEERNNDYQRNHLNAPLAIVDGISYPINTNNLFKDGSKYDQDVHNILSNPLRLFFKTGEIQMTANREEIDYQPNVIKTIRDRVLSVLKEVRTIAEDKVKNAKNLYEANVLWNDIRNNYRNILTAAKWDGMSLKNENIYLRDYNAIVYSFTRVGTASPTRRTNYSLTFHKKTLFALEDTDQKQPSKLKIATLLDQNPNIDNVYVFTFTTEDAAKRKASIDKLNKDYSIDFDKFDPIKMSTVAKKKIVRNKAVAGVAVANKKIYLKEVSSWNIVDSKEDITKVEGYYVTYSNKKMYINDNLVSSKPTSHNTIEISVDFIRSYNLNNPKNKIYGISDKYKGVISPKLKPFYSHLETEWNKISVDPMLLDKSDTSYSFSHNLWKLREMESDMKNNLPSTNIIVEYMEYSKKMVTALNKYNSTVGIDYMKKLFNTSKNTSTNSKMEDYATAIAKKYPLLNSISYLNTKEAKADFYMYIKEVDKIR